MSNCRLLSKSKPVLAGTELACLIGLNESMVLQQIEYWVVEKTGKDFLEKKSLQKGYHEGHYWVYNTYDEWRKQFPFWSYDTIKRTIKSLEKRGLILTCPNPFDATDRTKWYTVNYEAMEKLDAEHGHEFIEIMREIEEKIEISKEKRKRIKEKRSNRANCTIEENSHLQVVEKKEKPANPHEITIGQNALFQQGNLHYSIYTKNTNKDYLISSSSIETHVEEIVKTFEENITTLGKTNKQKLINLIHQVGEEFALEIILYCIDQGATTQKYVFTTFENLANKGINTVEAFKLSLVEHSAAKVKFTKKKNTKPAKKSNLRFNNFEGRYVGAEGIKALEDIEQGLLYGAHKDQDNCEEDVTAGNSDLFREIMGRCK